MDSNIPEVVDPRLETLRQRAQESAEHARDVTQEAQLKKLLLEKTRETFRSVVHAMEEFERIERKGEEIVGNVADEQLIKLAEEYAELKEMLTSEEIEYKEIKNKVELALEMANVNRRYLMQETQNIMDEIYLSPRKENPKPPSPKMKKTKKTPKIRIPGLPEMDKRASSFYGSLSPKDRKIFEYHREKFYLNRLYNKPNNKTFENENQENYHEEKKLLLANLESRRKLEGLISSRIAEYVMKLPRPIVLNTQIKQQLTEKAFQEIGFEDQLKLGRPQIRKLKQEELMRQKQAKTQLLRDQRSRGAQIERQILEVERQAELNIEAQSEQDESLQTDVTQPNSPEKLGSPQKPISPPKAKSPLKPNQTLVERLHTNQVRKTAIFPVKSVSKVVTRASVKRSTVNSEERDSLICKKIIDRFYTELKNKHQNNVDCMKIMNQTMVDLARSSLDNAAQKKVHKLFLSQLEKMT